MGKRLVAYFSAGGTTKKVAEMMLIAQKQIYLRLNQRFLTQKLTLTGWIKNPEAVWR